MQCPFEKNTAPPMMAVPGNDFCRGDHKRTIMFEGQKYEKLSKRGFSNDTRTQNLPRQSSLRN